MQILIIEDMPILPQYFVKFLQEFVGTNLHVGGL